MKYVLLVGCFLAFFSTLGLGSALALTFKSDGSVVQKDGRVVRSADNLTTSNISPADTVEQVVSSKSLRFDHLDEIMTFRDAVRFERRVGIGAPFDRVERYIGLTRREAVTLVIEELSSFVDDFSYPDWISKSQPFSMSNRGFKKSGISCGINVMDADLKIALSRQLISSRVPQFERLFLFWLDHFSVEMSAYDQRHAFARHIKIIRANSAGNFLEFAKRSLRDPALIIYLNNDKSIPQKPNENLAREFLELFTLGEGNYTERNIKDLARRLVPHGINFANEDFHFYTHKQATSAAKAFGGTYKTPDEFVDLLPNHPKFGHFLAKKFFNEYVALRSPTTEELDYQIRSFRDSGFEILSLLEATLELPSFWAKSNRLSLVKSPIEIVYGTTRTLGWQPKPLTIGWMSYSLRQDLDQDLFNPPNVAGWPTGKQWLDGQRLEKRIDFLDSHFGNYGAVFETVESYSKKIVEEQSQKLEADIEFERKSIENSIKTQQEIIEQRNKALDRFFTSTTNNQLAVEHIVVDSVSSDFNRQKWSEIRVVFYNVLLNEKKWDAIRIRFVSDSAGRNKYGDFIRINEGYSHPDFSYRNGGKSKSKGYYYRQFSYPSSKRTRTAFANADAKLLIKRLAEATNLMVQKLGAYPEVGRNTKAREWLKAYSKKVGFNSLRSGDAPVKVFAWGAGHTKGIKCGANKTETSIALEALSPTNTRSFLFLPSALHDRGFELTDLLIPDLPTEVFNGDFAAALTHEGFQLK